MIPIQLLTAINLSIVFLDCCRANHINYMNRRSTHCLLQASRIFGLGRTDGTIQRKESSLKKLSCCDQTPSPEDRQLHTSPFYSKSCVVMAKNGPHIKARCEVYPRSEVTRFPVPDDKVPWEVPFPEYKPVNYTSKSVLDEPPWADKKDSLSRSPLPQWNKLDGEVNRVSYLGNYSIDPDTKVPRNPRGRTGIAGRGCLGRWGPNHAADPIVTRWKLDKDNKPVTDKEGKKIAQFIAIQRKDSGQLAIPGGMVDAGEHVTETMKREFGEEALNTLDFSEAEKKKIAASVDKLFHNGIEVYRGYVDDPRNTDNAWMETVAMCYHDGDGSGVAHFTLNAGDDAASVQWTDISHELNLYANHREFLKKTAECLGASLID